jgi:hypothetical protein
MKSLIATSVMAAIIMFAGASQASAWYCQANGTTGASGWGRSSSLAAAQQRALAECAVRTPRGYMCYVSFCR